MMIFKAPPMGLGNKPPQGLGNKPPQGIQKPGANAPQQGIPPFQKKEGVQQPSNLAPKQGLPSFPDKAGIQKGPLSQDAPFKFAKKEGAPSVASAPKPPSTDAASKPTALKSEADKKADAIEKHIRWVISDNNDGTKTVKYINGNNDEVITGIRTTNADGTVTEKQTDLKTNAVKVLTYDTTTNPHWVVKNSKFLDSEGRTDLDYTENADGTASITTYDDNNTAVYSATRTKNADGTAVDKTTDGKTSITYNQSGKAISTKGYDSENRVDWEVIPNGDGTEAVTTYDDNNALVATLHRKKNTDGTVTDTNFKAGTVTTYDKDWKATNTKGLDSQGRPDWEVIPNSDGTMSVSYYDDNSAVTSTAVRTVNADGKVQRKSVVFGKIRA